MNPFRGDHATLLVVINVSSYLHNSVSFQSGVEEGVCGTDKLISDVS